MIGEQTDWGTQKIGGQKGWGLRRGNDHKTIDTYWIGSWLSCYFDHHIVFEKICRKINLNKTKKGIIIISAHNFSYLKGI